MTCIIFMIYMHEIFIEDNKTFKLGGGKVSKTLKTYLTTEENSFEVKITEF